ncbi:hypothetical protein [Pseudophaeobacter sp.]|uniref:hypothetical protein n=1 Tax=Pseudophaeobacter sp. TaxID=1971739 RepID=UPI0040595696
MAITFQLNGEDVVVQDHDPVGRLLDYLRETPRLADRKKHSQVLNAPAIAKEAWHGLRRLQHGI